ncbi:MAG: hypothetical protein IJN04_04180 [Clostridia bacterium]|nr:hypothetical protein [Clostridia bacterium]
MKKWISLGLCVLLLLSLTACDGELACDPLPLPEDEYYHYGMEQLELGNLTEAYALLKKVTDPKAAEMLEKFVFVPTTVTRKNSNGRDLVHTFTYNEQGNLLSAVDKGDYSWTMETDSAITYTYDAMGHLLSQESRYKDEVYRNVYTYDEKGNELTYAYYNVHGDLQNSYTNTYDERGRLAKAEHYDRLDAAEKYTEEFTYDEQDRVLTRTITRADIEPTVHTYVYAEDGSYHHSYSSGAFTYTYWYDKEGRTVKHEVVNKDTNEVKEYSETRYDEMGHEVYCRESYYGDERVKTTTYNEQGWELTSQTVYDGELYSMTASTYDEKGNQLSNEYFYGDSAWGHVTYTYDEQNRLLTKKSMSNTGWYQNTYTYDEAGYCIKVEQNGADADYVCECTRDVYGNILTYEYTKEDSDGGMYAEKNTAQWVLQYYPDGTPDELEQVLISAETWFQNAQE